MENLENKAENTSDKVKNKVENIKGNKLEDISGGYYGKDWNESRQAIYRDLGIKHERNTWHKDRYYYNGEEITSTEAEAMVIKYLRDWEREYFKNW